MARLAIACLSVGVSVTGLLTPFVDPLIASRGGAGFGGWGCPNVNPGAMAPFPGLRLGPDTTRLGLLDNGTETWSKINRKGGYFGSDNAVRAFSHTHTQGAGESDYGNHGMMVTRTTNLSAAIATVPVEVFDLLWYDRSPFATPLDHATEVARPGYYSVTLPAIQTTAELAASTPMAGAHRYTCSQSLPNSGAPALTAPCTLVLDVCHSTHQGPCTVASVALGVNGSSGSGRDGGGAIWREGKGAESGDQGSSKKEDRVSINHGVGGASTTGEWWLEAVVNNTGDFSSSKGVHVYFVARISVRTRGDAPGGVNVSASGLWAGHALLPTNVTSASVRNGSLGAFITFTPPGVAPAGDVILSVAVAVSWTSIAAAWDNLAAAVKSTNWTGVRGGGVPTMATTTGGVDGAPAGGGGNTGRGQDGGGGAGGDYFDAVLADSNAQWESLLQSVVVSPVGIQAAAGPPTPVHTYKEGGRGLQRPADSSAPYRAPSDVAASYEGAVVVSEAAALRRFWPLHSEAAIAQGRMKWMEAMRAFLASPQGAAWAVEFGFASPPPRPSTPSIGNKRKNNKDTTGGDGGGGGGDEALLTRVLAGLTTAGEATAAYSSSLRAADPVGVDLTVFYTALFRVFCAPSTYSNAAGSYLGFDDAMHILGGDDVFLSDLSLCE